MSELELKEIANSHLSKENPTVFLSEDGFAFFNPNYAVYYTSGKNLKLFKFDYSPVESPKAVKPKKSKKSN